MHAQERLTAAAAAAAAIRAAREARLANRRSWCRVLERRCPLQQRRR
jgi:hypothetical protein